MQVSRLDRASFHKAKTSPQSAGFLTLRIFMCSLVSKVAHPRKYHCHAVFIGSRNDFIVAH